MAVVQEKAQPQLPSAELEGVKEVGNEELEEAPAAIEGYSNDYEAINPVYQELLKKHSVAIGFLAGYRLSFVFRNKPTSRKGKRVVSSTRVFGGKDELYHEYDAEIEICRDSWNVGDDATRMAMLYHELCSLECGASENLKTVAPDVNEYSSVVKHYGYWNQDLQRMFTARDGEQLDLDDIAEPEND